MIPFCLGRNARIADRKSEETDQYSANGDGRSRPQPVGSGPLGIVILNPAKAGEGPYVG